MSNTSSRFLVRGTIWTIGSYGLGQLFRLTTNIVIARLLAPELFGIMAIVNSIRFGVEFFSDIGIAQNIVYSKDGENPDFYNTAWTLRLIRGVVLWALCSVAAYPVAYFYQIPLLKFVLPLAAISFVVSGLNSVGTYLLNKRMQYVRLNAFEVGIEFCSAVAHMTLVYLSPTIWALVFANLVTAGARMIGSYILLPGIGHRLHISTEYIRQMFHFGKWIFISSLVFFLSMYFDRLYLGKIIPLGLLGVYGVARSLSDLFGPLVLRLGSLIVFPYIASASERPRADVREQFAPHRFKFILAAALGLSVLAANADFLIRILYDQRYQEAGWILSILLIGAWFTIICGLNEATILGLGAPRYNAFGNSLKFVWLIIGLPLGYMTYGIAGAVIAVAVADLFRYIPTLVGQIRERFSFVRQDFILTIVMFGMVGFWEWLRWTTGYGLSFDSMFRG